ncbi:Dihydroneopterin aldolase [invertebrate metagenome]|uniref:dihydroneopterin aldolase n=1 Tax=invertebrate metagenome TaxID=1711999 RepID=A0A484H860_9ZZZZ
MLSTRIGIHAHERLAPQRIRINLDLAVCEDNCPVDDKLESVVCYETLLRRVRDIVANGHVNLVETLAERIMTICLQDVRVQSTVVKIEKIDLFTDVGSVGVEIERLKT